MTPVLTIAAARSPRRRGRWRRLILVPLALLALGIAAAFVWAAASGRAAPPRASRDAAERALVSAREAQAPRWAAGPFEDAAARLDAAVAEYRRQRGRLYPLRDFRAAQASLRQAEAAARQAEEAAVQARDEARSQAGLALDSASSVLEHAHAASRTLTDQRSVSAARTRAEILRREAQSYFEQGDYLRSREIAQEAESEARRAGFRATALTGRFVEPEQVRTWRRWVAETVAWSRDRNAVALIVNKERKLVTLYRGGRALHAYPADMGKNRLARKLRVGDGATPEGHYSVVSKLGRGRSKYYKALVLDYPNAEDRERLRRAIRAGEISARSGPGGQIEIHGEGGRGDDWTLGCVAVSNEHMDELFDDVPVGARVTIVGGEGSGGAFSDLARRLAPGLAAAGN